MSPLEQHLNEYLAVRRALGYKLERTGKLLAQFLCFLEERGAETITTELALEWATLPAATGSNWHSQRLAVIRGFATWLHAVDPTHEVAPKDVLCWRPRRSIPYLYRDEEIAALIAAAGILSTPHRTATLRTLIGLLAATGMRVGEAIRLDRSDIDYAHGLLVVRESKFGKSRELPLQASTLAALRRYLRRPDRPAAPAGTAAVLVSAAGTRLLYCNVQHAFARLVRRAGLRPRSGSCRPRLHDLRHTFAVRTVLDAYRDGGDPQVRLPLLSTYLGHVNPGSTYWYLQAAPELLSLAGERLERHQQGGRQ
ncbi:MAG: tyrosine-type recombinase/integrase [Actinobacteria bacterium]|nr:tyrosine-type recombinase/integrase [Actinomycetota bacterium]